MIDRGEAYMMMEKMVAARPQKSFLGLPWRARSDTRATAPNTVSTKVRSPRIFAFSLFGAKMIKSNTYTDSIAAPAPLIVDTRILFGDTKGRPYLFKEK